MPPTADRAAIGFRVKSGRTTVVLVTGSATAPRVADARTVPLADPEVPACMQPYHQGLDRPGAAGKKAVGPLVRAVERYAERALKALFDEYRARGHRLVGAGIVVGSRIDPKTIANDHIRAHAEEGRLFRRVVEAATRRDRLAPAVTVEKELLPQAADRLRLSAGRLKQTVTDLGRGRAGGWRAEEKAATLAGWLVLAEKVP